MTTESTDDQLTWTPTSWMEKTALQQPMYADEIRVKQVVEELAQLPPLVTSWEVEALKSQLGAAARGESFLLQGGDCAESFSRCDGDTITGQLKILLQTSLVLAHGTKRPVIRVGRIAGQYAKPRSSDIESRGEVTLPSYRGDLFNRSPFTTADRQPDPDLLLRGYERAALTLNFIRSLIDGGFADLHHPEYWDLDFMAHSPMRDRYESIVENVQDSIEFLENVLGAPMGNVRRTEIYTSHEGLSLLYEFAQTRQVPRREGYYNLSTHFPWIGMRTAQPDGAHVEYFRGIQNPIAVKVGPSMTPEWLTELIDILHPNDEPGRLTLIQRFGAGQVEDSLPALIDAVRATGKTVLWCADPMHGNTETTEDGIKTRHFDNILSEIRDAFRVHAEMGSQLNGVHFEMTGGNVTECIGGARGLAPSDLSRAYQSPVDPRLNYEQAMEMAMIVANELLDSRR